MNAFHFLSGPMADALGWTLLHAIWQGFALVLPIALILHMLRTRSSALRYQVSVLTLLAQLVLSAITFVWYFKPTVNPLPLRSVMIAGQSMPVRWQMVAQTIPWHQQLQQFLAAHLPQFVLIYLIGVALFGVRLAGGWLYLQRISQTATRPTTVLWAHLTDNLRAALSLQTVVQLRESVRISVPMIVGVLKPVLLLPVGLAIHLTTREIEAVLAHELAHIKRHDYVVNLLQSVVEVLYFFHPALWWLSARVREEREHCCDDLAVQVCGGDGRILAQALARVEELRLTQLNQTPSLAMAFAAKRQHLLHRVRRMLGVPTRPFVSNNSLAGLTLATILLMSISVYAMQNQEKPKPRTTQPRPSHSTRRHSKGNGTEYGMIDNKKVEYVIWKGQRLPAKHVARLQHQLDQVMAGKLSLDNVAQPDRDILLTIIETNQSFDSGMNALGKGLAHIDYDNIVASALNNIPLSPDGTAEGLAKVNYDSIIHTALASTQQSIQPLLDSLAKSRAYNQRQMDSLSQLLTQRAKQAEVVRLEIEKLRFPIEEVNRKNDVLTWRKEKLVEQRNALIDKHQRLLRNYGKQKLSQADVEKQVSALEPEIKKLETNMDELTKQFELSSARQDELKVPINKLNQEAEQLDEQIEKLSEEIQKQGDGIERTTIERLPLNREEKESVEYKADRRVLRVHGPLNIRVGETTTVPARPTKPAKSVITPRPSMKAIPSVPVTPAPTPGPAVRPPAPPIGPKSLRALPKPALAPALDTLGKLTEPPAYGKGKLAKLGAFIDNDSTIKTATFTFKPVEGEVVQVRSVTFTKDKDTQKLLKPGKGTLIDSIKIVPSPKTSN